MPDTAHDQADATEPGAPAWTADSLANALEHIRVAAVLHYAGGAFDPEHMRAIANLATEALNGGTIPPLPNPENIRTGTAAWDTLVVPDEPYAPLPPVSDKPRGQAMAALGPYRLVDLGECPDDEVTPDLVRLTRADLEVARYATGRLRNRDVSVELEDAGKPADEVAAYRKGRIDAAQAIEDHAEAIGWYESSGVWAEAIELAKGEHVMQRLNADERGEEG